MSVTSKVQKNINYIFSNYFYSDIYIFLIIRCVIKRRYRLIRWCSVGWMWVNVGVILTGKNRSRLKNHVSVPHFLPHTLHRMTWDWTRVASVRHRQLTTWTMVYVLINRNLRLKSFLEPNLWQENLSDVACPNFLYSSKKLFCVLVRILKRKINSWSLPW